MTIFFCSNDQTFVLFYLDLSGTQNGHKLSCTAKGNPEVNIDWFACNDKNEESCNSWSSSALQNDDNHRISSAKTLKHFTSGHKYLLTESELQILDMISSGTFKCIARNSLSDVAEEFIVHGNYSTLIVILIVVLVVVICVFFITLFCYRKFVMHHYAPLLQRNKDFKMDTEKSLFSQSDDLPYRKEFEFPRSRLELMKKIGSGQFGEV